MSETETAYDDEFPGDELDDNGMIPLMRPDESDEPNGYDSSYFRIKELEAENLSLREKNEENQGTIDSLLATCERQANTITQQYDDLKQFGEKLFAVIHQNNAHSKAVVEAMMRFNNDLTNMRTEISESFQVVLHDLQHNEGSHGISAIKTRYELLDDKLRKVQVDVGATLQKVNTKFGYGSSHTPPEEGNWARSNS